MLEDFFVLFAPSLVIQSLDFQHWNRPVQLEIDLYHSFDKSLNLQLQSL